MSASPDSPLGMLLDAGEGQEREGDVRGAIRVQYKTEQDGKSGRTRTQKLYPTYLDHQGNPTVGHGVLVTGDLAPLARNYVSGQAWDRRNAVFLASDIDAVQRERLDVAKREVKEAMPFVDFLGNYQQAVAISMHYTMGGSGFRSFKQFRYAAAAGDYYQAGLEMLRSDRSENIKSRNLWEALIFLTNGDPRLTRKGALDDLKEKVRLAQDDQNNKGKSVRQIMEEMYISKATELGYGPKS